MKKVLLSRRVKWCYSLSAVVFLFAIAALLSGHHFGEPLAIGAVSFALGTAIRNGHITTTRGTDR
jgi:hypothetical protein